MKFKIQVDGAEHEIEAAPDGTVNVGGEVFQAKVNRPSDDRRTVQLGEKSYEVRIVENCADSGMIVLEIAGERIPLTASDVTKSATASPAGTVGQAEAGGVDEPAEGVPIDVKEGVWAPVPGKIVNVLVKVGDVVEEGAPVVILEAMKMENELHAPQKGTVVAVLVKKGDQAEKGQLLVGLE